MHAVLNNQACITLCLSIIIAGVMTIKLPDFCIIYFIFELFFVFVVY